MPSNNPSGANGLFVPEPAYGDVGTQKRLAQSAPMSGAQVATAATEAPRRARRSATRAPARGAQAPEQGAPVMQQLPAPTYQQTFARLAQRLAADPGAGPNVMWLAQAAQQAPAGPPFQGH